MKKAFFTAIASLVILITFLSLGEDNSARKSKILLGAINEIIATYHYQPAEINDSLSSRVFDLYIKRLDYSKTYFLASDIKMMETYRFRIDEELKDLEFNFFDLTNSIIDTRINECQHICDSLLGIPFDFNVSESFETDEKKRSFAASRAEQVDLWRKILKSHTIVRLHELMKKQEADTNTLAVKRPIDSLEIEARKYVAKKFNSRIERQKEQDEDDRLSLFINCITNVSDPHTGYFPPKDKENFDISLSGKLEGIGATLQEKDDIIKVTEIVPGSASWRQGELQAGDLILKVAQGEEEAVDIAGMRLDEAVRLIRGPKGTLVKLTVQKPTGASVVIPIIRDVVEIDETYAKSTIISDSKYGKRIGYIYLPKFYVDFNDSKGRRCSDDVLKEIESLKAQGIDGLIFDVRDNGGGSLPDVVTIGGFFIKNGPIVQVKSRYVQPKILSDDDNSIKYDGPLVIMVNQFSASASEILAAAMQDYNRALIVGSSSSYGKGTVQRFLEIDRYLTKENADLAPLGEMKITIQKFYRINGGATQLKGVIPDIVFPDKYKYLNLGEGEQEYPMKWDEIAPVSYNVWDKPIDIKKVSKAYEKTMKSDTLFNKTKELALLLKQREDKTISPLRYVDYVEKVKADEPLENASKPSNSKTGLEIITGNDHAGELSKLDSVKYERVRRWHEDIKKDVELYHTYRLIIEAF